MSNPTVPRLRGYGAMGGGRHWCYRCRFSVGETEGGGRGRGGIIVA